MRRSTIWELSDIRSCWPSHLRWHSHVSYTSAEMRSSCSKELDSLLIFNSKNLCLPTPDQHTQRPVKYFRVHAMEICIRSAMGSSPSWFDPKKMHTLINSRLPIHQLVKRQYRIRLPRLSNLTTLTASAHSPGRTPAILSSPGTQNKISPILQ